MKKLLITLATLLAVSQANAQAQNAVEAANAAKAAAAAARSVGAGAKAATTTLSTSATAAGAVASPSTGATSLLSGNSAVKPAGSAPSCQINTLANTDISKAVAAGTIPEGAGCMLTFGDEAKRNLAEASNAAAVDLKGTKLVRATFPQKVSAVIAWGSSLGKNIGASTKQGILNLKDLCAAACGKDSVPGAMCDANVLSAALAGAR